MNYSAPGSVKELLGGGGNEKKTISKNIIHQKTQQQNKQKLFKALVCNRPNHKSKLGTHL